MTYTVSLKRIRVLDFALQGSLQSAILSVALSGFLIVTYLKQEVFHQRRVQ